MDDNEAQAIVHAIRAYHANCLEGRGNGGWPALGKILDVSPSTARLIALGEKTLTVDIAARWQAFIGQPRFQQVEACPTHLQRGEVVVHRIPDCGGQQIARIAIYKWPKRERERATIQVARASRERLAARRKANGDASFDATINRLLDAPALEWHLLDDVLPPDGATLLLAQADGWRSSGRRRGDRIEVDRDGQVFDVAPLPRLAYPTYWTVFDLPKLGILVLDKRLNL